jgi:hypothetical protein
MSDPNRRRNGGNEFNDDQIGHLFTVFHLIRLRNNGNNGVTVAISRAFGRKGGGGRAGKRLPWTGNWIHHGGMSPNLQFVLANTSLELTKPLYSVGPNKSQLTLAMNASFFGLILVLFAMAVLSSWNKHVIFLLIVSSLLWATMVW